MIWCSRRLKPPRKRTSCGSRAVAHDARTGHRCSAIVWHTCPTSSPKAKAYVRWTGQAAYASLQTGCCGAAARNRRCCCRDGDPAANGVIPPTQLAGRARAQIPQHHTTQRGLGLGRGYRFYPAVLVRPKLTVRNARSVKRGTPSTLCEKIAPGKPEFKESEQEF